MSAKTEFDAIARAISAATGKDCPVTAVHSVGGGCINHVYRLVGGDTTYFVKLNNRPVEDMFGAEAAGLRELAETKSIRVPRVICYDQDPDFAFLVLEWIELKDAKGQADRLLGQQLAQLHRHLQPYFGWHRDNAIGQTPQLNEKSEDWISFWKERRLGFQLKLAGSRGHGGRLQRDGERLMSHVDKLFRGYTPSPSLLHGDLWNGNVGCDTSGQPVIFDPACYYGDREADLAMTELFGGFSSDFYAAYQESFALDAGYKVRKQLYNLYHILNHLNLFGSNYGTQAEGMIGRLLAEVQ